MHGHDNIFIISPVKFIPDSDREGKMHVEHVASRSPVAAMETDNKKRVPADDVNTHPQEPFSIEFPFLINLGRSSGFRIFRVAAAFPPR